MNKSIKDFIELLIYLIVFVSALYVWKMAMIKDNVVSATLIMGFFGINIGRYVTLIQHVREIKKDE